MLALMDKLKVASLSELFDLWKKDNKDIGAPCFNGMCPDKVKFNNTFTIDGFLSDCNKSRVLFIGKEPRLIYEKENCIIKPNKVFWFRSIVEKEKAERGKQGNKYYNYADLIVKSLCGDNATVKECAYMNLNKRGGFSVCDEQYFEKYIVAYKEYIKAEIEIINPEHIVLLGLSFKNILPIVKQLVPQNFDFSKIYILRHPCMYRKKEIENIMDFCLNKYTN